MHDMRFYFWKYKHGIYTCVLFNNPRITILKLFKMNSGKWRWKIVFWGAVLQYHEAKGAGGAYPRYSNIISKRFTSKKLAKTDAETALKTINLFLLKENLICMI